MFGQSEQHCKRPSTHARDAHLNVTRPGVVRAASTRVSGTALLHALTCLVDCSSGSGGREKQRVSNTKQHRFSLSQELIFRAALYLVVFV